MTSDKRTFHVHPNLETSEEETPDAAPLPPEPPLRVNPMPIPSPVYINTRPDYRMPPESAPFLEEE